MHTHQGAELRFHQQLEFFSFPKSGDVWLCNYKTDFTVVFTKRKRKAKAATWYHCKALTPLLNLSLRSS